MESASLNLFVEYAKGNKSKRVQLFIIMVSSEEYAEFQTGRYPVSRTSDG